MPMDARSAIEATFAEMTAGSTNEDSQPSETPIDTQPTEQSTQETASPATQDAAPTTEQAAVPQTTDAAITQEDKGPIPFERHKAVLENTRKEYGTKLEALKWAEGLNGDDVRSKLEMVELLDTNPAEFFRRFQAAAREYPELIREIETVFKPQEQEQPKEDVMPPPDKLLDSGDLVYSDKQLLKLLDWKERQIDKKYEQRFGPVAEAHQASTAFQRELERQRPILEDARKNWEGFAENEKEIAKLIASDARVTIDSAYRRIVIPKLKAEQEKIKADVRKQLIDEMNQRGGSSTVRPGSGTPAATQPDFSKMDTAEVLRETFRELSGGAA